MAKGPLPACRYDDILTQPRAYTQWPRTLVDTILSIPESYVPPDLTKVSAAGLPGTFYVRAVAIPDLAELAAAAKAAGNPVGVESAYRSYATQKTTFAYWVSLSGYTAALLYSARPGHSEHQLGLTIDFKTAAGSTPWDGPDWGQSPAGSWLGGHAWEYGFVLSYPKGQQAKTCYSYEPWHFRYVGRLEAAAIHASGLTPREYLWRHFTLTTVPSAAPTSRPTHAPTAPPSVTPSAVPSAASNPAPSDPSSSTPSSEQPSPAEPTADASPGLAPPMASPGSQPPVSPLGTWQGLVPVSLTLIATLTVALVAVVLTMTLRRRSNPTP